MSAAKLISSSTRYVAICCLRGVAVNAAGGRLMCRILAKPLGLAVYFYRPADETSHRLLPADETSSDLVSIKGAV